MEKKSSCESDGRLVLHRIPRLFYGTRMFITGFYFLIFKFFFILYNAQQMHNYFAYYHTPTCFDTIVSSAELVIPWQVTQVFQTQLLVIQFTDKMFHIGFMQDHML